MEIENIQNLKKSFIDDIMVSMKENDYVDPEQFQTYRVKRGLRNEDGTGVVAGLTRIGEVHGYVMSEGEKTSVEGKLRYRGYEIEDLVKGTLAAKRHGFEEVCYLLLFGLLPTEDQLDQFKRLLQEDRVLPKNFMEDIILKHTSNNIMNMLARGVLALYTYDEEVNQHTIENSTMQLMKIIAKLPLIAAYSKRAKAYVFEKKSLIMHEALPGLSTAENFLRMIREDGQYTPLEAEVLDLLLMLHAEHGGGNNSTFVARVVASTDSDVYSSVAAAIGSLKGPKHGGANHKVMGMMDDIMKHTSGRDEEEVSQYLRKIVNKEAYDQSGLIYGFGHAIYTASDPRAEVLRGMVYKLAAEKHMEDELAIYEMVERAAPPILKQRRKSDLSICCNVDFYSGFVYKLLGITPDMYTPLFAIGRIAGWAAHIIEEQLTGNKIVRPAYKTLQVLKEYKAIDDRE